MSISLELEKNSADKEEQRAATPVLDRLKRANNKEKIHLKPADTSARTAEKKGKSRQRFGDHARSAGL